MPADKLKKKFNEVVDLIESDGLKWRSLETREEEDIKSKILLHAEQEPDFKSILIGRSELKANSAISTKKGPVRGDFIGYSEFIIITDTGEFCGIRPERNHYSCKHFQPGMLEVDESLYELLAKECFKAKFEKTVDEQHVGLYLNNSPSKSKKTAAQSLSAIKDYLLSEVDFGAYPTFLFQRLDQRLPAKLKEWENKLCANEFLKLRKQLEQEFKEKVNGLDKITCDSEFEKLYETLNFARMCKLDTKPANSKLKEYKLKLRKEYWRKIKKIEEAIRG